MAVLFGYRHVTGVPLCPCRDPGNYLSGESTADPLRVNFRCWCGSRSAIVFDDLAEFDGFLRDHCGLNDKEDPHG